VRRPLTVEWMLLTTIVLWSLNLTVTRYILTHGFQPLAYATVRYGTAALIFVGIALVAERSLRLRRADLGRRLASGTAVAKEIPVRPLLVDVGASAPFVFAVVPFEQIAVGFGHGSETRQLARPGRALERTREHAGGRQAAKPLPEPARVLLAALGQRQVGQSRVLAREAPRGLAVPDQMKYRKRFAHVGL
jgi:hypothetical protein